MAVATVVVVVVVAAVADAVAVKEAFEAPMAPDLGAAAEAVTEA